MAKSEAELALLQRENDELKSSNQKLEFEHQRLNDEHLTLQETQRIYVDLLKLEEEESKAKDSFANAGSQDDTTQTILKRCIQGTKTLALVV